MSQALADRHRHNVIDITELTRQTEETNAVVARALDALVENLDAAAATEADFDFPGLLKVAQQLLHLDDLELSRALKVSRPTVGRWMRGVSKPHPLARKAICDVLAKSARAQVKHLRA